MAESTVEPITATESSIEQILQNIDSASDKQGPNETKLADAWGYRKTVMAKYDLPELGSDPVEYIRRMEEFLKRKGIDVRGIHEFDRFFQENHEAAAVANEHGIIIGAANGSDIERLKLRGRSIAHEAVHALQDLLYPRMPLEEMEREAYYYEYLTPSVILNNKDRPDFLKGVLGVLEDKVQMSTIVDERLREEER